MIRILFFFFFLLNRLYNDVWITATGLIYTIEILEQIQKLLIGAIIPCVLCLIFPMAENGKYFKVVCWSLILGFTFIDIKYCGSFKLDFSLVKLISKF